MARRRRIVGPRNANARTTLSLRRLKQVAGITLLETILSVGIVAVLAGLTAVGVKSARDKARSVRELGAARNLMTAYLAYAGDNNGRLLPGVVEDPTTIGHPAAVDRAGNPLGGG